MLQSSFLYFCVIIVIIKNRFIFKKTFTLILINDISPNFLCWLLFYLVDTFKTNKIDFLCFWYYFCFHEKFVPQNLLYWKKSTRSLYIFMLLCKYFSNLWLIFLIVCTWQGDKDFILTFEHRLAAVDNFDSQNYIIKNSKQGYMSGW